MKTVGNYGQFHRFSCLCSMRRRYHNPWGALCIMIYNADAANTLARTPTCPGYLRAVRVRSLSHPRRLRQECSGLTTRAFTTKQTCFFSLDFHSTVSPLILSSLISSGLCFLARNDYTHPWHPEEIGNASVCARQERYFLIPRGPGERDLPTESKEQELTGRAVIRGL